MLCADGLTEALNGASEALMKQENLFEPAVQDMNTVFEIGLTVRRRVAGIGGCGGPARMKVDVGLIGKEPIQGDQNEVGEDFLFDATFGFGVKVLDVEDALADLIQLLDAPSSMVDVDELLQGIALRIEQRRIPKQNRVSAMVYFSSRSFSGTISRSGYWDRISACFCGEGSSVITVSVSGLAKKALMALPPCCWRRKMA